MAKLKHNQNTWGAAFPPSRLAVSALFFLNGLVVGSWAPKIPEFAQRLGLSETQLGLMIVAFGVGSLAAMPVIGGMIVRSGSRGILRLMALGTAFSILIVSLVPNIPSAVVAIAFFGATVGGMDVAMNANAVSTEREMGRAIMSSCHGFWSLGGLVGAGAGGFLIERLGLLPHAAIVTVAALALAGFAWTHVTDDGPKTPEGHKPAKEKLKLPLTPLPWLIGIMALLAFVPEGAVLDWGALYLIDERGGTVTQSGFVFGAFSATMAVLRFAGDGVRDRFGAVRTLRVCAIISIVGLAIAGLAPNPLYVIAGFAIAGIGLSNIVPIAFSAAGNQPGLAPGVGLSVATFLGYSGALFAPTFLGFVAEHVGFSAVFLGLSMLGFIVLAMSGLARYAEKLAS